MELSFFILTFVSEFSRVLKAYGNIATIQQIKSIMDKMKRLFAADEVFSAAATALQKAFTETMLEAVPFNEDGKFLFTQEGEMDYSECPTITLVGGTSDTCVGFEKGGVDILYILFGDGEADWDTYGYEPEEISIESIRDIMFLMDEWFKSHKN